ncbi:phage infection protein [Bombiscardovia apis]|uniref:Phage infection protein n=1 Tax=Bombiscardovia apis TaxID=2932182 RepID=A0ABN6SL09_9BIFI|nr:YhgE/Pip domain-containing protein [Bombiscardovia apis]BDR55375.1 phage infection protein [Bombiscardovia apis]
MKAIWKLFTGDIRRLTSNVVSMIIAIGLIVIPGLFTWFNVAASWDPFSNTANLKFAVANVDKGYKSDLIPVKITVGDTVVNELRANSQLDWTFTSQEDAIDGTKSGKYYASVIIPEDFSKDMMTFFAADVQHAKLTYYTNEKTNALAPKVTGQGADQVSGQINEMFAKTITGTALSIASQLADQLNKPEAKDQLASFSGNLESFSKDMTQAAQLLDSFSALGNGAQALIDSSNQMTGSLSSSANQAGNNLKDAKNGVKDVSGALNSTADTLSQALSQSSSSFASVGQSIDSTFDSAGRTVGDVSKSIRHQADLVDQQIDKYQQLRDTIAKLPASVTIQGDHGSVTVGGQVAVNGQDAKDLVVQGMDKVLTQLRALSSSLNSTAQNLLSKDQDREQQRKEIKDLAQQAKASVDGVKGDYNSKLKPDLDQIISSVNQTTAMVDQSSGQLTSTFDKLSKATDGAKNDVDKVQQVLNSMSAQLNKASGKLSDFSTSLTNALNSGDMDTVRQVLDRDPDAMAATLAAPVKLKRTALYPVSNFGTALTPFYTFVPLWVGSLLLAVTLKITVSRKTRAALGDPKPHQLFLGHYGIFALLSLLQATFSCAGTLLFLGVEAVHPWLFMASSWISALVYSFFVYTLVASFGNVGKAIGVIILVMQISGSGGAYPLQVLPGFVSAVNPYLPATHSIQAMRAAIAGIYMNDFWMEMGKLLLFVPPMLILGLFLRKPLVKFNQWTVAKVETTKLMG